LADLLADLSAEVVSDAVTLISELVTNAVLHGQPPVRISLHRTALTLRVAVDDRDPTVPESPDLPLDPTQVSGRGLFIVNRLATAWGVDRHDAPAGKTVWFTLNTE
jgi:anti-sigma regulatory factor (Ser/Thr protein kinase)